MSKGSRTNRSRDRSAAGYTRPENVREERKGTNAKDLLTFSFKDIDETQPKASPQSILSWANEGLLSDFIVRLKQLSKLTRDEALNQQQIKIYGNFPPNAKTDFYHPEHVDANVSWSVIKAVGGQKGVVAGYIVENTFYIVFFDKEHRFWIATKKHT